MDWHRGSCRPVGVDEQLPWTIETSLHDLCESLPKSPQEHLAASGHVGLGISQQTSN